MTKPDVLGNRKPADKLKEIRDEIKRLKADEDYIRRMMIKGDMLLVGDQFKAVITKSKQNRLDRKAVEEKFGDLSEFTKEVEIKFVKIEEVENEDEEVQQW